MSTLDRLHLITEQPTAEFCKSLCEKGGGIAYRSGQVVTHVTGRGAQYYVLATEAEAIQDARQAVVDLTGYDNCGFSPGAMSRALWRWYDYPVVNEPKYREVHGILPEQYHYQAAAPCRMAEAVLYDMRSAYAQIVERLGTPHWRRTEDGGVEQFPSLPKRQSKWEQIIPLLTAHKYLRVGFVGVQIPLTAGRQAPNRGVFTKSGEVQKGRPPAAAQVFAALVIRITYELVQMAQIEGDAWYANIDSVMLNQKGGPKKPDVWDRYGIRYSEKGRGEAHVLRVGAYRIGDTVSGLYEPEGLKEITKPKRIECKFVNLIGGK